MSTITHELLAHYLCEVLTMSYTLENFEHNDLPNIIARLPVEVRLNRLIPKDHLKSPSLVTWST